MHIYKKLNKNSLAVKKVRGQSEATLQTTKTSDIKEGQEEAGCMRQTSELFTGSTAVKIVNALNKPPLKLLLSYQRLNTF